MLSPFEEEDIIITVNLNASTALGVPVTSNVLLNPLLGDANPADNEASWTVTTQGSYDPNDIIVNRSFISTDDIVLSPELEYLIRFQNTGTDTAFTVKIKNPLPLNTILYTFEIIESSHQVQLNYNNADSIMWFQFDNILLPDSNTNELLSHGYVRYKIKPIPTLWTGDLISNQAYIFFDFNAPVITNIAETDIILLISVNEIIPQFDFSIYPNPVTNEINIPFTLDSPANLNVSIYNSVGQLKTTISNKQLPAGKNNINFLTESLSAGVYFLTLEINGISATRKFIKF